MDTQLKYMEIVKAVLREYAESLKRSGVQELHILFDDERRSYMLLDIGWYDHKYIHNATVHVEIIEDKLWIQNDDTEDGIAPLLVEAGISKSDIVLGFRHPTVRPYTEFAVA